MDWTVTQWEEGLKAITRQNVLLEAAAVRGKGSSKCSGIEPFVLPFLSPPSCSPLCPHGQHARSLVAQKEVNGCDVCATLETLLEKTLANE